MTKYTFIKTLFFKARFTLLRMLNFFSKLYWNLKIIYLQTTNMLIETRKF